MDHVAGAWHRSAQLIGGALGAAGPIGGLNSVD